MFVALALMHCASTMMMPLGAWWPGLVALVLLVSMATPPRQLSMPGTLFAVFCLVLLMQVLLLSPVYEAKAVYLSFTLFLSFLFFSSSPSTTTAFRLAISFAALMSCFGLYLWFSAGGGRENAIFGTPNTFATYINLFLAPMLAYYLMGKGGRGAFVVLLLLFTALLTSQSRGGYLGLLASMAFFGMFVGVKTLRSNIRRIGYVVAGFVCSALLLHLFTQFGVVGWGSGGGVPLSSPQSANERLQIYSFAWQALKENFPAGTGTFTFKHHFEAFKTLSWQDRHTSFVHNDYLQLAVENGVLGIGVFLAMIAALYFYLLKYRRRAVEEQRLPLIMSAAGITSMLAHAMVDFPFYVPIFQAVMGAYLGVISRHLAEMGAKCFDMPNIARLRPLGLSAAFIRSIATIAVIGWLGLPFFAKASADYGLIRLNQNDYERAVYWHSFASLLQPRSFEWYWREGVIWRDLGTARRDAGMIQKADALFAKGSEANPYEVIDLLSRVSLHRQHQGLLQKVSREEVMSWILRAKKLQPFGVDVQVEYIRTLAFFGTHEEAVKQAEILLGWRPSNKYAQRLLADVKAMQNSRSANAGH